MEVAGGKIVGVEDDSHNRVPPCTEACPLPTDVSRYVHLISDGKFDEALSVIRETNPLPAMCGHI
jgi:NADPH-dependent glutamate synthase beta subunit-like oxidoreductase